MESHMAKQRKRGKCAYCGQIAVLTRDHIPPVTIFAPPRPSNLITVPACEPCHKPWSKDDEYFRERMCLNDEAHGHPDVTANLPSVFSALARPQAKWMRRKLLNDTYNANILSPSGLWLGKGLAFDVDLGRICRVVERIVRGLYYRECKNCLPADHDVRVITKEIFGVQDAEYIAMCRKTVIDPLLQIAPRIVGQHTFSYRFAIVEPASVWGMKFFNAIDFLAITAPKRE